MSILYKDPIKLSIKLSIVPILEVNPEDIAAIVSLLSEALKFDSVSLRPSVMGIPPEYRDKKRGQYQAQGLIALLSAMKRNDDEILLGVTMLDLYSPGLNFVFGLAMGRDAIISLCRLSQDYYKLRSDRQLFIDRAAKEAVHEIGHELGLGHCKSSGCVMFFSNSILDTDSKSHRFCTSCSAIIPRDHA